MATSLRGKAGKQGRMRRAMPAPRSDKPLDRFAGSSLSPPDRAEEALALSLAPPAAVLAALLPVLGEARAARLDQVAAGRLSGLTLVLEDLYDPHNGGAALRSCEAVGLLDVHFVAGVEPFRVASKVTQGCHKWLDLHHHKDTAACVADLRARGHALYAAVPGAALTLEDLDPLRPAAFLIGNEHAGLSAAARAACDAEFAIPLHGFSESLNLSVATALTVYTHARRRRAALGRPGDLSEDQLLLLRARYYARGVRGVAEIVRHHLAFHR